MRLYTTSNSSIQAKGKANLPKRSQSRRSERARSCFSDPANENPSDPLEINADITKTTINPK